MPMERRGAHTVARLTETPSTPSGGITATTGVERIASRARSHAEEPFTALMHHFSVENLRACFKSLYGNKAIGVDRVTKADYEENLEVNLQLRFTVNCTRCRTGLSQCDR